MRALSAFALMLSSSALASEVWVELDIQALDKDQNIHLEVPLAWVSDVDLDVETEDFDAEKMAAIAEELPVGKRERFLLATEDDTRVTGFLHHREDPKGPAAESFYMRGKGGDHGTIELSLPIALMSALSGVVSVVEGPDVSKVVGRLGGRPAFKLIVVDGPDEHFEIGTE